MEAIEVNTVEQQREQLIEKIRTLPADDLQKVADFLRSRQEESTSKTEQSAEQPKKSPYEAFKKAGLIGCIKDAPPDLSANYKDYLAKGLAEKYGRR